MRNYLLKVYLEDGSYGYYRGMFSGSPYITDDPDSSRLFDTGDEALETYRRLFQGNSYKVNGKSVVRYTVVPVNVNY